MSCDWSFKYFSMYPPVSFPLCPSQELRSSLTPMATETTYGNWQLLNTNLSLAKELHKILFFPLPFLCLSTSQERRKEGRERKERKGKEGWREREKEKKEWGGNNGGREGKKWLNNIVSSLSVQPQCPLILKYCLRI